MVAITLDLANVQLCASRWNTLTKGYAALLASPPCANVWVMRLGVWLLLAGLAGCGDSDGAANVDSQGNADDAASSDDDQTPTADDAAPDDDGQTSDADEHTSSTDDNSSPTNTSDSADQDMANGAAASTDDGSDAPAADPEQDDAATDVDAGAHQSNDDSAEGGSETGADDTTEVSPDPDLVQGCAVATEHTELRSSNLVVLLDISASMGAEILPYYSRTHKWDPVSEGMTAFFESEDSAGLSASLTFFPDENAILAGGSGSPVVGPGSTSETCEAASYTSFDVPLRPLPAQAFAESIDAISPADEAEWRIGTPTGPVIEGTYTAIDGALVSDPGAAFSIVLISDGEPANCTEELDDIAYVAEIVSTGSATVPVYVLGIDNPTTELEPNPPDSVSGLHLLAEAGGTEQAVIIDTNDPASTAADVLMALDSIASRARSCKASIPLPGDIGFDAERVNVRLVGDGDQSDALVRDPECSDPRGWRYDDPAAPQLIELCEQSCAQVREQDAELEVTFGCASRVD